MEVCAHNKFPLIITRVIEKPNQLPKVQKKISDKSYGRSQDPELAILDRHNTSPESNTVSPM